MGLLRALLAKLHRLFWRLAAVLLILAALLVQIGRMATPMVADYRQPLVQYFSDRLSLEVQVDSLAAQWSSLLPVLVVEGVTLSTPDDKPVLTLESARAEVDLLASLWDQRLRFSAVEFLGVQANFVENRRGSLQLEGLQVGIPQAPGPAPDSQATAYGLDDLRELFLIGRTINLIDLRTHLQFASGHELSLVANRVQLEQGDGNYRLTTKIQLDERAEALTLLLEGRGDSFDINESDFSGYLHIDQLPTERLLALLARDYWQELPAGQWRKEGRASLEAWFDYRPGQGVDWRGLLALAGLPFELEGQQIPFRTLQGQFTGGVSADGSWQLLLQQLDVQWGEARHPAFALSLGKTADGPLQLQADQLQLELWGRWLSELHILPEALQTLTDDLNPTGRLRNVRVSWQQPDFSDLLIQTNLEQVSVGAWGGAPALTGVDGYVQTGLREGFVELDSQQGFSMHYPKVYALPMEYHSARGQVAWWIRPEAQAVYINSGPVGFTGEDGQASGFLYIDSPLGRPDQTVELLLQIGIRASQARFHKKYVPFVVSENLRNWLDGAVGEGQVHAGGFLFHGFLHPDHKQPANVQLWLDIDQAALDYQPPWPALSGVDAELWLDSSYLRVDASGGNLLGSRLHTARVQLLPDSKGLPALQVRADLSGPMVDAQHLLRDSPLAEMTGRTFASWQLGGDYRADLGLVIPMAAGGAAMGYEVAVDLQDASVTLPFINLSAQALNGQLRVSDQDAISIGSMTGTLWDRPLSLRAGRRGDRVELTLNNNADIHDLTRWAGFEPLAQTRGAPAFQTKISLPWQSEGTTELVITSDLVGLGLDFPAPLDKQAAQAIPLHVRIPLGQQTIEVDAIAGEFAQALLRWSRTDEGSQFDRGDIQFFRPARWPAQPLLSVGAEIDQFELTPWLAAFEGQWNGLRAAPAQSGSLTATAAPVDLNTVAPDTSGSVAGADPADASGVPLYLALDAANLQLDARRALGAVRLEAIRQPARWLFHLRNERLAGSLTLPKATDQPLDLSLSYLRLPLWPAEAAGELFEQSRADAWDMVSDMPDLNLSFGQIFWQEKNIGSLGLRARRRDQQLILDQLSGSLFGLRPQDSEQQPAVLVWDHGANRTGYRGRISATDLGSAMTGMGMAKLIESETAVFDLDLGWPGDPASASLANLSGDFRFDVSKGRFLRTEASASDAMMRLMGIFNFDTWVRRLQLDFSDVYASGMAYDRLTGDLRFNQGQVALLTPVSVRTPSSKMLMTGQLDLVANQIDAGLTVNLPVLDNLAFIAAVSAGLPVAAGVFVASRLFEKQFDKMTSVNYGVTGSLDKPQVKFQQSSASKRKAPADSGAPPEPAPLPGVPIDNGRGPDGAEPALTPPPAAGMPGTAETTAP